jgi:hypothetical protein
MQTGMGAAGLEPATDRCEPLTLTSLTPHQTMVPFCLRAQTLADEPAANSCQRQGKMT